ncbi:MAG: SMC family ATPase [Bacteroidota bacterium]|nr:SMC family ATPase [Bacteroidota bacterium]
MIPISLTIQGLYSYQTKQTIDFSKLTQAGLFGIFGSVGCGKSTILEAISFALFGESERLNARDNRNYNMMNLKSNELLIDFEFKTGGEQRYRFIVKGKRNSKRFDDVRTFDRLAYKLVNNDWQPIEVTSAGHITGLNYNNFHRTIIIPQGKFQEFLQLSAKDRTSMLQELFNLNRFELSGRVITLENQNNASMQHLRGQLQSIGEINPDDIAAKEKLLAEMEQNLLKLSDELLAKQKNEQEYERVKSLHLKIQEQKQRLTDLQKDQVSIETLEREVKEFETFIIAFKSDFDQLKSLETNRTKTTDELKAAETQHSVLKEEIRKAEDEFVITQTEFNQKEKLLQESEELLKLVDIRKLQSQNEELTTRSQKGKAMLDDKVLSITNNRQSQATLKEQTETIRKELPDMARLAAIREWFTNKNHGTTTIAESNTKIESLSKEVLAKKAEALRLPEAGGITLKLNEDTSIAALNAALSDIKNETELQKRKLDEDVFHLEIRNKLNDFVSSIEDGKPCPLCGSEHHPNVLNAQNVSDELSQTKNRHGELTKKLKKLADIEKDLVKLTAQVSSLESQLANETGHLKELTDKLREHEAKFTWSEFSPDNDSPLNAAFEKAGILTQELENKNNAQNGLSSRIETEEKEKEKYAKALEEFERQTVANNSQIILLNGQLSILNAVDYKEQPTETLTSKAETLKKQYETISLKYQQEDKRLSELKNQASALNGSIETNKKTLLSLTADLDVLNAQIADKLQASGNLSHDYVKSVLAKQLDTAGIKKRIETYRHELQTTLQLIAQTESELQGKIYDEMLHAEVKEQLATLSQQITGLNQELGRIKNEIQRQKTDLERYLKLKAELDQLELRGQDITEMKNLFRGNAFVNFISTVYLETLCKAANDRFYKLTRQKLSLELADDNSFEVRDFMNEGKLRNVKTLSGGQTFQASLSLALALADSIQKLSAGHENFFFLDEGFGTLDKDSLNIVFDTLKSLRRENRIVGVISHVEEMQQEIETYLKVVNDEHEGSLVKASWE